LPPVAGPVSSGQPHWFGEAMTADAPETEVVTTWKVACDGGEGALGHPRVWLTIPPDRGWVECGYCDKRYVIDRAHAGDDH